MEEDFDHPASSSWRQFLWRKKIMLICTRGKRANYPLKACPSIGSKWTPTAVSNGKDRTCLQISIQLNGLMSGGLWCVCITLKENLSDLAISAEDEPSGFGGVNISGQSREGSIIQNRYGGRNPFGDVGLALKSILICSQTTQREYLERRPNLKRRSEESSGLSSLNLSLDTVRNPSPSWKRVPILI